MKLIRKSVFETNSSSCHSLTLGTGDTFQGMTPNENNMIVLPPQEFGWEQDTYCDAESRLSYVWIYIRDWSRNNTESFLTMFKNVVKEHTGADDVTMDEIENSWSIANGYIDHQSVDDSELDYLFKDEDTLKNFLFNSDSSIETDNDNH